MPETYDAKAAADVGAAALVRECIEEDRRVAFSSYTLDGRIESADPDECANLERYDVALAALDRLVLSASRATEKDDLLRQVRDVVGDTKPETMSQDHLDMVVAVACGVADQARALLGPDGDGER